MRLEIKNSLGVYKPLDLFEDFEILYNHQYIDYTNVSGNRIPYTNKFKIPLNNNNRDLCGLYFDLAYPKTYSVDGRAVFEDNTIAFYFIADIERQVINVLEPYIEISIIDRISKALKLMSQYKMSDLMSDSSFDMSDSFIFDTPDNLTDDEIFLFPFYNFNNKAATFAYDPMRKINQLQPTFILNKLVKKIFNYSGVGKVLSKVLNDDNGFYNGLNSNQLGLMIPSDLKTLDDTPVIGGVYFSGDTDYDVIIDRVVGVPSPMQTSSGLNMGNMLDKVAFTSHLKFNSDYKYETLGDPVGTISTGIKSCSMVDGKLNISISPNVISSYPSIKIGSLLGDIEANDPNVRLVPTSLVSPLSPPDLDVKIVNCDLSLYQNEGGNASVATETSTSYDIKYAQKVGKAVYQGIVDSQLSYIIYFEQSEVEFDVEANQDLELALILTPPNNDYEYTVRYNANPTVGVNGYVVDMTIYNGFIKYDIITDPTVGQIGDSYFIRQIMEWSFETAGVDKNPAQFTYTFSEATSIPSGMKRGSLITPSEDIILNPTVVDMSETMKSIKDYKLLEVIKMIMERFNLNLYTDSYGDIHLDSYENMLSGETMFIDHLIDGEIDASYAENDKGNITIKDTNPSFYDDDFNELDEYLISEDKRETFTLTMKSAIVGSKMFLDEYNETGYDLLKWVNDNNYWGESDRQQVRSSELKPTFCILELGENQLYFPYNECTYSDPLPNNNDPEDEYNVGFYNSFKPLVISGTNIIQKTIATNLSESGLSLISFDDNDFIPSNDTLFKIAWYNRLMDIMNDKSVIISVDIYMGERDMKKLIKFPFINFKGQQWHVQGFNDYPLSAQSGGVCNIKLIKKRDWLAELLAV